MCIRDRAYGGYQQQQAVYQQQQAAYQQQQQQQQEAQRRQQQQQLEQQRQQQEQQRLQQERAAQALNASSASSSERYQMSSVSQPTTNNVSSQKYI